MTSLDEARRRAERAALLNPRDEQALAALAALRRRAGICPTHVLPLGRRGTCRVCREEARVGREVQRRIRSLARDLHVLRRDRYTYPEGEWVGAPPRWVPAEREAGRRSGVTRRVARTLAHCHYLAARAVRGYDVPPDVARICAGFTWPLARTRS